LNLLRTDLAIRRYRTAQGNWPDSLESLVPEQLPRVPLDPFSDKPLVYRRADDDFLLYSVGFNRFDDGGQFDESKGVPLDLLSWGISLSRACFATREGLERPLQPPIRAFPPHESPAQAVSRSHWRWQRVEVHIVGAGVPQH
jgi:hypothetical protein